MASGLLGLAGCVIWWLRGAAPMMILGGAAIGALVWYALYAFQGHRCQECGSKMDLKRAKSKTARVRDRRSANYGASVVGKRFWLCPHCKHIEDLGD